jgi:predicted HTH domain antitoxin
MKALTVTLPDNVDLSEKDIKMILAGQLYELGKLTLGQAAGLVGISKSEFIETMGHYGFSLFSTSIDDLRHDIEHA